MQLKKANGLRIDLDYDGDGFPEIEIEVANPVSIVLNDVKIQDCAGETDESESEYLEDGDTGIHITVQASTITIDTGDGFYDGNYRPTLQLKLNGEIIHEMFDGEDIRWNE